MASNAIKFGIAVAAVVVAIWIAPLIPNPIASLTKK